MPANHKDQFERTFKSFDAKYRPYRLFSDFCIMAAASLSNSTRLFQKPEDVELREAEYAQCANRYAKDELEKMTQLLAIVTMALEENPDQDFMGLIFMNLGFGNERTGQFFTPYHVSKVMAQMLLADAPATLKTKRYITILDPCVGGGGMMIAAFNAARDLGINPQTQCLFHAVDIDGIVLRMAYIQCSLLGLCGHFIHGNSLSAEQWGSFTTPFYYLNSWRFGQGGVQWPEHEAAVGENAVVSLAAADLPAVPGAADTTAAPGTPDAPAPATQENRPPTTSTELSFTGGRLVIEPAENRVRLFYDDNPSRKILGILKGGEFLYVRSIKGWQRDYSEAAIQWAKTHVGLPTA